MPSLFVSYRREDSAGFAGRLTDALEQRLGAGSVFRDVDDIRPGADFEIAIEHSLRQVQAVLVVIGPGWLAASRDGERRLDRADDHVRREIECALASGKPVVPVLVGGAAMPAVEALPPSLRGLANRHALSLDDASWPADLQRLYAALEQWLAVPAPRRRLRWPGMAAAAALAGMLAAAWLWSGSSAPGPQALQGVWEADVSYQWNVELRERFDFVADGDTVEGSASFLGVPRLIEQVEWRDGRLRFATRAESIAGGDAVQGMVQHYEARVDGDVLHVRLQIQRGGSVDAPLEFVAVRR
ncbi:toll/interleukin-1 receptor domain-containing protein [Thauera butanivorans]|uniref:toll/interleukin-1 receptor domain-containing protein n=1 Tax=Thauera butanivorans TaxID=86174 RepID=UPI000838A153|nr:toll/interleukin-1 receptor domain-containing protein [Thauera butanivorans]